MLAGRVQPRAAVTAPVVLHVDRVFTIRGAGTVLTGTLWSGAIGRGATLRLLPGGGEVRVRGVQVHGEAVEEAVAGQRVAVNLAGVAVTSVARGDVLVGRASFVRASRTLGVALTLREAPSRSARRVQVHHGTRDVPGRLVALGDRYWQLRLEQPLLVADGDRLVIRRIAPPDTLGGGVVLEAAAQRRGSRQDLRERLGRIERGERPDAESDAPRPQAWRPRSSRCHRCIPTPSRSPTACARRATNPQPAPSWARTPDTSPCCAMPDSWCG